MKKNSSNILKIIEKLLSMTVLFALPTIVWGIIIIASIYIFTIISFQPYSVWKDFDKNPSFYIKISFSLSFLFIIAIVTTLFLVKKINQFKIYSNGKSIKKQ